MWKLFTSLLLGLGGLALGWIGASIVCAIFDYYNPNVVVTVSVIMFGLFYSLAIVEDHFE